MNEPDKITSEILVSAKKEFLANGFEKASMRVIAKNAGVTTGALYTRYKNKNDIFSALVSPFADDGKIAKKMCGKKV